MRENQADIDHYKNKPFPHLPTSPAMNNAFLTSQPSSASERPSTSDVPVQSDVAISTVATQATTAFLMTELTDKLLRRSVDVLAQDYDVFMQVAILLCSDPLKRSHVQTVIKNVLDQKEIIWARCQKLKMERATLRKNFRKAFPGKPVVNGVKVYTTQTGSSHPVNGPLYQQLYGPSFPTTLNTSTKVSKSTKGSAAKKIKLLTSKISQDTEDTKGDNTEDEGDEEDDDDDDSDDEDKEYKEDGEEEDEDEDEETEDDEETEEDEETEDEEEIEDDEETEDDKESEEEIEEEIEEDMD